LLREMVECHYNVRRSLSRYISIYPKYDEIDLVLLSEISIESDEISVIDITLSDWAIRLRINTMRYIFYICLHF
jgi:hypothetical protein